MGPTPPAYWHLEDIAATGDLAKDYGVSNSTIANWSTRYPDFPRPLLELSTGPVYSRWQVRQWHDGREWQPGKHGR
ncbi:hypothetical protein [Micromonospora sp. NPDC002575]|uniref:hypothetical protein n=1 Tax=Micromonospora sp. NPDC002575 TaxID=3364222 RepID=UPI0036B570C5